MPERKPAADGLPNLQQQHSLGAGVADEANHHSQVDDIFELLFADHVGEKTGELESALKNIALYSERTSNEKIDDLVSMIEPAFTIAIGLGVGLIAVSIIAPMYSLPASAP